MISIIVPYTTGVYLLEDCLKSLECQTYQDFEVIIVQDQIPKYLDQEGNITQIESPEHIIKKYQKSYSIIYLKTNQNLGVGACRNMGIKHAHGKYIYFLDMDDYLMEDTLERLMQACDDDYDIIYGKRVSTWYKRKVYLESLHIQEEKEQELEGDKQQAEDEIVEGDDLSFGLEHQVEESPVDKFIAQRIKKSHGLLSISVLNLLISKKMIQDNNLYFDESLPLYSDLVFYGKMLPHIQKVQEVPEAIYIKRKRNNPVQYPAICQYKSEEKFSWYLSGYKKARAELANEPHIVNLLDQKLINYYCNNFVTRLRRSEFPYWREERFAQMQTISKQWDSLLVKSQSKYKRHLIHALQKGELKRTLFFVAVHLGRKKAKKFRKNHKLLSTYLYFHYFLKMPVRTNYIMCESFLGRNYADSPKNLFEYMSKTYPGKYKFIWSVDKKTKFPYPCKVVKRFGIRYAYYLARSKYFIFNMRQPAWMRKREETIFLQTWHGTPLKKLVFDQEEVCSATPLYKQQFYGQSRAWDYLISDNTFSTEVFRSAFLYQNEIIETGYPRNDLLYLPDKEKVASQVKKKLHLPQDKKVILYAPTWRDDEYYDKGQYKFALHMDLKRYQKELGKEYIILLRTHYFIADALDLSEYEGFAFNVSKYDDIAELYLISDICITDYSSVFFDFANLRRPILFYTYDLDKYRDILRGFYLDIEKDVPGPLLFTDDEVIEAIQQIDQVQKKYASVYETFWQRFCSLDDGNASKRIVEKIFEE